MPQRRPPGDGGLGSPKCLLTLAVLLFTHLPLVEAQQQQRQYDAQPLAQAQPRPHDFAHHVLPANGQWFDSSEPSQADGRLEAARRHHPDSRTGHSVFLSDRPVVERKAEMIQGRDGEGKSSKRNYNNINLAIPNRHDNTNKHIQNNNNNNNNNNNTPNQNDARAVATLAPAQSVRAPPSSHRLITRPDAGAGSGISTQPSARSLEEWEVEDFVLLATVDGDLYASDRQTGAVRWHLEVDQPMIETIHHRLNTSELDDDHHPVDHYVWAVEPARDGSLYIWMPGAPDPAIIPTGLTMKSLVEELSPLANDNPPVIYTGTKKTTMITLDASTGRVLKWFGSTGSHVNEEESCLRPRDFYDLDREECSSTGTITLGRTEYEVSINRKDGHPIANLRYAEWTPNNFDRDLMSTYRRTLDNRYHSSRHDGGVYAFNLDLDERLIFAYKFDSPVARVFDVCRPWGVTPGQNPDLLALPQPVPAPQNDDAARLRNSHVFLNQTCGGSWYALSGLSYPLIVDAPPALTSLQQWLELDRPWNLLTQNQKSAAMIGRHSFDSPKEREPHYYPPTLPGGSISQLADDPENDSTLPTAAVPDDLDAPTIVAKVRSIPQQAADSFVDLFKNPVLISILVLSFFFYHKDLIRWSRAKSQKFLLQWEQPSEAGDPVAAEPTADAGGVPVLPPQTEAVPEDDAKQQQPQHQEQQKERQQEQQQQPVEPSTSPEEDKPKPAAPDQAENGGAIKGQPAQVDAAKPQDPSQSTTQPSGSADAPAEPAATKPDSENAPAPPPEKKKGKAHRGRRGGVKHRKNGAKKVDTSAPRDDEQGATSVEDAVKKAKKLGNNPPLEPDVVTISTDMQSVTGPVFKLGNIEVDMENQLGTGSNGTLVFAGRFDGREVAVKRMLIQFYDIASQETRLLRESDDHPNVIRYYAQEARDGFLYIALERCAASLADIVERPSRFQQLAQAGRADLPGVLYQIANGINHLHSLRIVHRDLKPQNILVNMDKGGRPRLLVSDFGLCKKLEGGQSSFGATTGRAAGTTGWRAPELLLDDDKDPLTDASINSGSGTPLVNSELLPNRRATRSIDIFSLGLVFFYVLSNGQHPFDCGDRYMREVNIRKNNYNLSPLSVLGDFAEEAKDLIGSMLNRVPKERPTTHQVMSHPFFWSAKKRLAFLCDVSDHFEKEPRDPPSEPLLKLEADAPVVTKGDFLRHLPREFVDSLGKQRKYTGSRLLDLLRALRNKKNHYEDMSDSLKRTVGPLPEGYLSFWTVRFPGLLLVCWYVVREVGWADADRFKEYYEPAGL